MSRHRRFIGVLSVLLLAHAGAAYGASTPSSPNDPPAGSPAAAVYQLPFEKGRADGAPKGNGGVSAEVDKPSGNGGDGPDTSTEGSFYRSENNFGSSSQVPGTAAANGGGGKGDAGSGGGTASGGGKSGNGESPPGSTLASASSIPDSGNTSPAANIGLLCVIGLLAIAVGFFLARANRLRSQQ